MLDPTLISAANSALETAANKALQYDPATKQRLSELAGQSLAVEVVEFKINLCVHFDADGLRLSGFADTPTTRLRGSLPGLLKLAAIERIIPQEANVEVWGDSQLLIHIKNIISELELDWEEVLIDALGDVPGHQLAQFLRKQVHWLRDRETSVRRLAGEFLTEELRAVPTDIEIQHFSEEVDQLRLSTDRLYAKLSKLKQLLAANGASK